MAGILAPTDVAGLLAMTMSPSNAALQQLLHTQHDQQEDAHKRLRTDLNGIGKKVDGMEALQTDLQLRLTRIEERKPTVENVAWSTNFLRWLIVTGVAVGVALSGWMWSIQSSIKDVHTDVMAAAAAVSSAAKLQDERTAAQKDTMDQLRAAIEMRRVEIQRLSDKLSDYMQTRPKER